jgi:polyisoprenoid-binding protein YceI
MSKFASVFAIAVVLVLGIATLGLSKPASTLAGSWQIDAGHSDAQIVTDATTDYGKTKLNVTLGFGRVTGRIQLNNNDLAQTAFDFSLYPATSMAPVISEDGKFLNHWLANLANHTLVCFHSKGAVRTPDGHLQTTGNLVLTRVDRSIDATVSEAYSGPVYGPPVIHRVSHEATFIFDLPADGKDVKSGELVLSGKTAMFREDYPQLMRAVVSTYWPPVVQDEVCQPPANPGSADFDGSHCSGKVLSAPGLPDEPSAANGQDVGVDQGFSSIVGNHLNIAVHLRLTPAMVSQNVPGN